MYVRFRFERIEDAAYRRRVARRVREQLSTIYAGQNGESAAVRIGPATWEPTEALVAAQAHYCEGHDRQSEMDAINRLTRWAMLAAGTTQIGWEIFSDKGECVYITG